MRGDGFRGGTERVGESRGKGLESISGHFSRKGDNRLEGGAVIPIKDEDFC